MFLNTLRLYKHLFEHMLLTTIRFYQHLFEHLLFAIIYRASMSIDVSANKMIDKAQREGKYLQRFNATQVSRHIVHGDHVEYLTDWAPDKCLKELEISKICHGMKMKPNEYWVYTPYVNTTVCASTVHRTRKKLPEN